MELNNELKNEIKSYALSESPDEACGLFIDKDDTISFIKLKNKAQDKKNHFVIDFAQVREVEKLGKIVGFFHSHSDGDFSIVDKHISEKRNLASVIYKIKEDQFSHYRPQGLEIPFLGRYYVPGIFDCFALTQDFFTRQLNIVISDFDNPLRFMSEEELTSCKYNNEKDTTLSNHFQNNGFVSVKNIQVNDIILARYGKIKTAGHCMVMLKDNMVLRHFYEISEIIPYSNHLKNRTTNVLRHSIFL